MAKRGGSGNDQLPPHSVEAEQGVLGCVLLAPMDTIPRVRKKLRAEDGEEFFELRHRTIWRTLAWMFDELLAGRSISARPEGTAHNADGIDMLTVMQRLKDNQNLDGVGGTAYLATLPDAVPSAENLDYYLEILVQKYVLRQLISRCTDVTRRAFEWQGTMQVLLDDVQRGVDQLQRYTISDEGATRRLKAPSDFGEDYWKAWFGGEADAEPGCLLPDCFAGFPFRIREAEMTLVLGEKGKGKTTLLSYIVLHLLRQDMKFVIASFESSPLRTLKLLHTQLIGTNRLPETTQGQRLFREGLAWLNSRVAIYDFQGIADYREVLSVFQAARARGFSGYVVDNLMKLGVAEDDMSGHGIAANAFADFAIQQAAHVFMVNHLRKSGEGNMRNRSRGSLRWVDASANVVGIERNEKKWEKIAPFLDNLQAGRISVDEYNEFTKEERKEWDAKFILSNQRLQGTQQNGSRALWFLSRASQYFDHNHPLPDETTNWLQRWCGREKEQHA